MADTLDVIKKLIALALNNPSEEEARAAALKAVQLLDKYEVPLGNVPFKIHERVYTPPDPEFQQTVDEILSKGVNPDDFQPPVIYVDQELDDDHMRKKITLAWRAIREERKKLEYEWYLLNQAKAGGWGASYK